MMVSEGGRAGELHGDGCRCPMASVCVYASVCEIMRVWCEGEVREDSEEAYSDPSLVFCHAVRYLVGMQGSSFIFLFFWLPCKWCKQR